MSKTQNKARQLQGKATNHILWHSLPIRIRYRGKGSKHSNSAFALYAVRGYLYELQEQVGCRIAFHELTKPLQSIEKLHPGQQLEVELSWVASEDNVPCFIEQLNLHSQQPQHQWQLESVGNPVTQRLNLDAPVAEAAAEIRLHFLTTLPLTGKPPFDGKAFLKLVNERFEQLFGFLPALPDRAEELELLVHLWKRSYSEGFSRSQNPDKRRNDQGLNNPTIKGRLGSIYLRGASARLVQTLRALQPLHLATKPRLTGWGQYTLCQPATPFFDHWIDHAKNLEENVGQSIRHNDGAELFSDSAPLSDKQVTDLVADRLAKVAFPVQPSEACIIRNKNGDARMIERLHPLDLIAQQHLLEILNRHLDASLAETSLGFRPGRSRVDAAKTIREAISQGYSIAIRADIEQCFSSIEHERLILALDKWLPRADHRMRLLLHAFIQMPYQIAGETCKRQQGLAQGSPLSPLLTNLYLDAMDRSLQNMGVFAIRYADDILMLCRTKNEADDALLSLMQSVEKLGLRLNPDKTAVIEISAGFRFLGEEFNNLDLEDPVQALAAQKKPLILSESYLSLGTNGDALEIRRANKLLDYYPLRRLSEIIILGRASVSTALLEKCARFAIPVSMALESGYQIAVITPDSRRFHKTAQMHGKWYESLSDHLRLELAKELVLAKISNHLSLMQNRRTMVKSPEIERMKQAMRSAQSASSMMSLRGAEGAAARVIFAWLQSQILVTPHEFKAKRRERGAADRFNSMLNFGYYLLYTRINALLRAHGLNPYLGILHDGQDNYETLVADMQEPFRCHVDRLVLRLINRRQIGAEDFNQRKGKGYWLSRAAIRCFINEFERIMGERIARVLLRDALLVQIRSLRDLVTGKATPFWLHRWEKKSDKPSTLSEQEKKLDEGDDP